MNMLYNGVELPVLPKDAQYDKALIFYALNDTISLIYTDTPFSLRTLEPLNFDGAYRSWEVYSLTEDGVWGNKHSDYSNYDGAVVNGIIWANYDVLDPDGNIYLAASEPLVFFGTTHTVHVDLLQRGVRPRIDVVQGDTMTRRLDFELTAGGVPWVPPDGTTAALSYIRPDGVGRVYDRLDDGTEAYTVSDNHIRMELLPEVMEVAGEVMAVLRILRSADGKVISTFVVDIAVEPEPSYAARQSEALGPDLSEIVELVSAVKGDGAVTVTATYADGRDEVSTIVLDDDENPVSVIKDGVTTALNWEGFDE